MHDNLIKEEEFHDDWAESMNLEKILVDEFFEAATCPENQFFIKEIGDITNKKVLELGCGAGEASVYFAKKGADVIATDLSSKMLEVAEKLAAMHNTKIKTKKMPADKIDFPDNTFDIVYAGNLLHHVDVEATIKEVQRVLKNGGYFLSWDPLAHNPAINIYRRIASEVRTEDEHPLRMKDVRLFKKYFSSQKTKATWLFTLWIFVRFYFIERVDPNKERYWKKIIYDHKKLEKKYHRIEKLDNFFLKIFPFLKRYCWNIAIIARK